MKHSSLYRLLKTFHGTVLTLITIVSLSAPAFATNDVYIVTSTFGGTGSDAIPGTLHWALAMANKGPSSCPTCNPCPNPPYTMPWPNCEYDPDVDTIKFAIAPFDGTPKIILLDPSLNVTQSHWPVYIDGFTQPGSYIGHPLIVLGGSGNDGINFTNNQYGNASGSTVRGLVFANVKNFSIYIENVQDILIEYCWVGINPDGSKIPATVAQKGIASNNLLPLTWGQFKNVTIRYCVFANCINYGIELLRADANIKIHDCKIGTGVNGTENYGNGSSGIFVYRCTDVEIYNNVIGNNGSNPTNSTGANGIQVQQSNNNYIHDNKIGISTANAAMPNYPSGISLFDSGSGAGEDVGAKASVNNKIQGNNISYNHLYGVEVVNTTTTGNIIGADVNGNGAANIISYNNGSGVYVGVCCGGSHPSGSAFYTTIRKNSIFCNDLAGQKSQINLHSSTPLGNQGIAAPVINSGTSTVTQLKGTAPANKIIDVYRMSSDIINNPGWPQCGECNTSGISRADGYIWVGNTLSDGVGNWTFNGSFTGRMSATATDNVTGNIYTNNTSEFSLCYETNVPAPVIFLSIKADKLSEHSNLVSWATAAEKNNHSFLVQSSTNGIDFYTLGTVNGQGNSYGITHYSFTDTTTNAEEIVYYRLIQTDNNGTEHLSNVVSLNNTQDGHFGVYPNPFQEEIEVISWGSSKTFSARLFDLNGRIVAKGETAGNSTEKSLTIKTSGLSSGIYFLEYESESERKIIKMMK